jgi:hypothetical protein
MHKKRGRTGGTAGEHSIQFRQFYILSLARVLRWVAQAYQYIHTLVNTYPFLLTSLLRLQTRSTLTCHGMFKASNPAS